MKAKITYDQKKIDQRILEIKKLIPNGSLYIVSKSDFYSTNINISDSKEVYGTAGFINIAKNKRFINFNYLNSEECETSNSHELFVAYNLEQMNFLITLYGPDRVYLRVDPFLGGVGIEIDKLPQLSDLKLLKGIVLHFDEVINDEAIAILARIRNITALSGIKLNLGGSVILNYPHLIQPDDELRLVMDFLLPREGKEPPLHFSIESIVLNQMELKGKKQIGYASDKVEIEEGTLFILDTGYYDIPWIGELHKSKYLLDSDIGPLLLITYPAMNTCWAWSKEYFSKALGKIKLIQANEELINIAKHIDKDIDELICQIEWEKC